MTALRHLLLRCLQLGLLLLACAIGNLIAGCGGGEAEDDGTATTDPVDCQQRPEACR